MPEAYEKVQRSDKGVQLYQDKLLPRLLGLVMRERIRQHNANDRNGNQSSTADWHTELLLDKFLSCRTTASK